MGACDGSPTGESPTTATVKSQLRVDLQFVSDDELVAVVTNVSETQATNVAINDRLFGHFDCKTDTLAPGESTTCPIPKPVESTLP